MAEGVPGDAARCPEAYFGWLQCDDTQIFSIDRTKFSVLHRTITGGTFHLRVNSALFY